MAKKKTKSPPKKPAKKKAAKAKPKKQPAAVLVTVKDAAAVLRVDEKTLRRWIKKGCPATRRKDKKRGGPARIYLDPAKIIKWCEANTIELPGSETAKRDAPPNPTPPPGATRDPNLAKSGIVGALARMRAVEQVTYASYLRSVGEREPAATIRSKQKLHLSAVDALRKAEKELPAILEGRGESIPLQTAIEEQVKINMAIKRDLLTLPRKLAPEIGGLSDDIDPGDVEAILAREVDDLLRHLASGRTLQAIESGSVQATGENDG